MTKRSHHYRSLDPCVLNCFAGRTLAEGLDPEFGRCLRPIVENGKSMSSLKKCVPVWFVLPVLLVFGAVRPDVCAAADTQQIMLQTTGALCAQGLYLTYTSVGTLADGYVKKVYNKDEATQYLGAYVEIIKRIKEQLNKLQQSGAIQGEDVAFMAKIVDTYDLLGAEANAFQSYLTSGGQANIDVYDTKRKAAWKNIQEILGIND
jgi:hypothetical protein